MVLENIHFRSEENAYVEMKLAGGTSRARFHFFPKSAIMNIIYKRSSPNFATNIKQI